MNIYQEPYARSIHTLHLTRNDADFAYIPIYRSGSTWTREYLHLNNFQEVKKGLTTNKRKLVILREPLERIISGMLMRKVDIDIILKNKLDLIDTLIPDPHTNQQIHFLGKIDESYDFIKFGQNIENDVKNYCLEHGVKLGPAPAFFWDRKAKLRLWQQYPISPPDLLEYIQNHQGLYNKFQKYLKDDYELYNKVTWYESN